MTHSPTRHGTQPWRGVCLPVAFTCLLSLPGISSASAQAQFQTGFLRQEAGQPAASAALALGALADQQHLPPGRYRVVVVMNMTEAGQHELEFQADTQTQSLQACLPPALLGELGLRLEALEDTTLLTASCLDLPSIVPGALVDFDSDRLRLMLSIPQMALRREVTGFVDPQHWDSGITAAFVNYQASAQRTDVRGRVRNSQDLYLNSGLNIGGWRLRSQQSWRDQSNGARSWNRASTYAQHDLPGTWGALTLGESFTDSQVFRSLPVSGVRVASDLDMLPDTLRSYAPVIRGVAQTRAKLEVWQNGYPIYSTYVSPGPYAIDDLNVGGSGELEIVLTEADGQVRRFQQPYATISNLLRPGVWRYSAAAGRYNPPDKNDTPLFWQGTLAVGTPWSSSVYTGLMASAGYQSTALGLARDLGEFGAVSFDVTHANSELKSPRTSLQGQSYSLRYSKSFLTGTHLRFAGYRYSTEGYRDFDEWINQRNADRRFYGSRRSRLEVSLQQSIGTANAVSLNLSQQDYWQRRDVQRQFQLNFSGHYRSLNYNLYASQSLSGTESRSDRQIGLSLSLPLDFGGAHRVSMDMTRSASGTNQRATLTGQAAERVNYSTSISRDQQRKQSLSLAVAHETPHASLGAGGMLGEGYRNLSLNAAGAVLLHDQGLVFASYLGDTVGLVEVPGIPDLGIRQASVGRTNAKGYAVVPYLRPYKSNALVLDTDQMGADVEIENATAQVVPRRGAIVKHRFEARRVNRIVLTTHTADGSPLPFGAQLLDSAGEVVGMVGQGGQVLLALDEHDQTLDARWGTATQPRCRLQLEPSTMQESGGYRMQTLPCN